MIGVKEAGLAGQGREPYRDDSFKYLRDSLEEDDYAEGGWCVIGGLSRFV